jgi:hypothetical protein
MRLLLTLPLVLTLAACGRSKTTASAGPEGGAGGSKPAELAPADQNTMKIKPQDWKNIVRDNHKRADPENENPLVLQAPASPHQIKAFQELFGPAASAELQDLYRQMNGYGIDGTKEGIMWEIVPTEKLPVLLRESRYWIKKTHPDLAEKFFPFYDWNCGDFSGYLLSEDGTLLKGIYTFWHEDYENDKKQDSSEFMHALDDSLEDFVSN